MLDRIAPQYKKGASYVLITGCGGRCGLIPGPGDWVWSNRCGSVNTRCYGGCGFMIL